MEGASIVLFGGKFVCCSLCLSTLVSLSCMRVQVHKVVSEWSMPGLVQVVCVCVGGGGGGGGGYIPDIV